MPVPLGDRAESPIIEHKNVDAGEAPQEGDVGAVRVREPEIRKESAEQPSINHAVPLATGLLSERTGQIGLADAGGAGDQDVVVLDNPAADGELPDHGPIQAAARARSRDLRGTRGRSPLAGTPGLCSRRRTGRPRDGCDATRDFKRLLTSAGLPPFAGAIFDTRVPVFCSRKASQHAW